jgi:hypothetical protein
MTVVKPAQLNRFIDLDSYPVHDLDSAAGIELVASAREMMARDTLVTFADFLRPGAVDDLASELSLHESNAHRIDYQCTPYGWMNNSGFPPEHPRSAMFRRKCGVITTEMLSCAGVSQTLFQFDELTDFVRRLLGYASLYRSTCPTLAIQVNTMSEGESFEWHYDTNDGVVSFVIRNADRGGVFEYVPLIRDEDDENYEAVTRVFDGEDKPKQPEMAAGTFSLFLGRRSIHRVAPVGPTARSRISLLYSYDREPGMVFPKKTCERITSSSDEPYFGALTPSRAGNVSRDLCCQRADLNQDTIGDTDS